MLRLSDLVRVMATDRTVYLEKRWHVGGSTKTTAGALDMELRLTGADFKVDWITPRGESVIVTVSVANDKEEE